MIDWLIDKFADTYTSNKSQTWEHHWYCMRISYRDFSQRKRNSILPLLHFLCNTYMTGSSQHPKQKWEWVDMNRLETRYEDYTQLTHHMLNNNKKKQQRFDTSSFCQHYCASSSHEHWIQVWYWTGSHDISSNSLEGICSTVNIFAGHWGIIFQMNITPKINCYMKNTNLLINSFLSLPVLLNIM